MEEPFGFGARNQAQSDNEELSDLERGIGVRLSLEGNFVPAGLKRLSEKGAFVEIGFETANGTLDIAGVYRGISRDGYHVIMPCYIPCGEDDKNKKRYKWENTPLFVRGNVVIFVNSCKDHLSRIADGFDSVYHLGKCYDAPEKSESAD